MCNIWRQAVEMACGLGRMRKIHKLFHDFENQHQELTVGAISH